MEIILNAVGAAENKVNTCLNIPWHFVDLFYAYCESKGIDDPEEQLTEEEYSRMELDCASQIIDGKLQGLREVIIEDINERLRMIWDE